MKLRRSSLPAEGNLGEPEKTRWRVNRLVVSQEVLFFAGERELEQARVAEDVHSLTSIFPGETSGEKL